MISNRNLDRYADVLIWALKTARTGKYKKDDIIMINFDLAAVPLAEIMQAKLLDLGLHPILRLGLTTKMEYHFFKKANNKQLVFTAPGQKELFKNLNGSIYLRAPESLTHLSDIDPKRIGKALIGKAYQDWSGAVKFEEPQGLKWHNVSPPHLILQQTEVRQPFTESKLVFPPQFGGDGKIAGP